MRSCIGVCAHHHLESGRPQRHCEHGSAEGMRLFHRSKAFFGVITETSAIRVLTYFNAGIAFTSIIAFPPSAVSEPLRAIRSVERSHMMFSRTFSLRRLPHKKEMAYWDSLCAQRSRSRVVFQDRAISPIPTFGFSKSHVRTGIIRPS